MKPGIHPPYGPVVFRDRAGGFAFLTRSTMTSDRTVEWEDGRTYPVVDVEISSASHPFYTGQARVLDTAGRVERFERRYGTAGAGTPGPAGDAGSAGGAGRREVR
ncbi:type B 50S ribosomal protein L31 [Streptomyces somaliensis]|uniref:type B 50S ribosomal protein L31 n=1 Tax=Streptomyces somaliensis TaxID=78355 RepID=UPI0020CD872E|nr:type B 50S ribosomal protein L31 [Streptomyces somaliensis]MCP9945185.1 type B 50S ribosomal protein L31 [Streptomyces somaliensis]MCP9974415.1 type B 50S ribosomal protein L31 [Streptomyces somaliensis]